MSKNYLFILFIFISAGVNSQAPNNKIWDYRFGGDNFDVPQRLVLTSDHGFLLVGVSNSSVSFDKSDSLRGIYDFWIVRIDSLGNKLWDKTFGCSDADEPLDAIELPDSGFIIGGISIGLPDGDKTALQLGGNDFWVIRIDKNGNKLWDKCIGGASDDELHSLLYLPDGNVLVGGLTQSDSTGTMSHHSYGGADCLITKIDLNGNILWDRNYGGTGDEVIATMLSTPDSGVIFSGSSNSPAGIGKTQSSCQNSYDYWIVKIDKNGNKIWDRSAGGSGDDFLDESTIISGNKILFAGGSESPASCDKSNNNYGIGRDFWVLVLDSIGNIVWEHTYGGSSTENFVGTASYNYGTVLITGNSASNISGDKSEDNLCSTLEPWILAIDTMGNKLWDKTLKDSLQIVFCYGIQVDNNCYAFLTEVLADGGDVSQAQLSINDYWIVKFCDSDLLPSANYTTSNSSVCQNTCINFDNISQYATSYEWLFPGGSPVTDTSTNPQGICYYNSGSYDVTLIATNSAGSDTITIPNYVTVFPQIQFSPITQNGDTLFSVAGYSSYQWFDDTTSIIGANNYYYVANHNGDYSVLVTDNNGCSATAQVIGVYASINEQKDGGNYYITYSDDDLIIGSDKTINCHIEIVDAIGQKIFSKKTILRKGRNIFSMTNRKISSGIFIVTIYDSAQTVNKKIIVR